MGGISESSPANIRELLVSTDSGYEMSVKLGVLTASLVNLGMETLPSSAAWRITMGLDFLWASLMLLGLVFVVLESPKYLFATGQREKATAVIAGLMGPAGGKVERFDELEGLAQNGQIWPRILLATRILSFQQLTGVNFFYYGTSIFTGPGISNSYITQVILSLFNVLCTIPGLYFAQRLPRKRCLVLGALWMALFLVLRPAITARIDYAYGYVFGGCCLLMALMVQLCLVESQGRTMEGIDVMYNEKMQ
ncbi:hypothetical protein PG993_003713 [Apiospora rasikravindrae]|uniref:Major facilitator superfamily (MFS) profile domain-containing protein n=1 Tax=Apiospora rasikravindrae TaxID=990691 RepID=A0ABR1U0I6_9PEZI